ncbi:hypothetical protein JB92DRAFT_452650 [Gautieria morchelliformis]|nr:hypothetical protein JB92DRAFT_452650 [Gautieria morchelliformis]
MSPKSLSRKLGDQLVIKGYAVVATCLAFTRRSPLLFDFSTKPSSILVFVECAARPSRSVLPKTSPRTCLCPRMFSTPTDPDYLLRTEIGLAAVVCSRLSSPQIVPAMILMLRSASARLILLRSCPIATPSG